MQRLSFHILRQHIMRQRTSLHFISVTHWGVTPQGLYYEFASNTSHTISYTNFRIPNTTYSQTKFTIPNTNKPYQNNNTDVQLVEKTVVQHTDRRINNRQTHRQTVRQTNKQTNKQITFDQRCSTSTSWHRRSAH